VRAKVGKAVKNQYLGPGGALFPAQHGRRGLGSVRGGPGQGLCRAGSGKPPKLKESLGRARVYVYTRVDRCAKEKC